MKIRDAELDEIIRVNQAGEYGARRIYEGQLDALKNEEDKAIILHMYEQEQKHLDYFDKEIAERRIRPTLMQPLWKTVGYIMGLISAKLGNEAAMACTAAVEEVIDQHYAEQIDRLSEIGDHEELVKALKSFRAEEVEHKDIGLRKSGGEGKYRLYKSFIRGLTKAAIGISKKI